MAQTFKMKLSDEWINKICAALTINPSNVSRILIDLSAGEIAIITVTMPGIDETMQSVADGIAAAVKVQP